MRLVKDWRSCLKWYSQQMNIVGLSAVGVWSMMPGDWKVNISTEYLSAFAILFFVSAMVGRIIDQNLSAGDEK